jgi:hypothetical protein
VTVLATCILLGARVAPAAMSQGCCTERSGCSELVLLFGRSSCKAFAGAAVAATTFFVAMMHCEGPKSGICVCLVRLFFVLCDSKGQAKDISTTGGR